MGFNTLKKLCKLYTTKGFHFTTSPPNYSSTLPFNYYTNSPLHYSSSPPPHSNPPIRKKILQYQHPLSKSFQDLGVPLIYVLYIEASKNWEPLYIYCIYKRLYSTTPPPHLLATVLPYCPTTPPACQSITLPLYKSFTTPVKKIYLLHSASSISF